MDAKTEQMLVTMGAGLAKKVLMLQAAGLVSHGMMSSNYTEVFVSLGMAAVGATWSFWNDYGKVIFFAQMDVLKAKALAQAAKLKENGIKPVTVTEIAEQHPTLTPADVTKTIATLPPDVQATVAKVAAVAIVLLMFGLTLPQPAAAQVTGNIVNDIAAAKRKPLTGNIANDIATAHGKPSGLTGAAVTDMQNFFNAQLLPDLQYALKLAQSSKNNITADCYQAWIDIITTQQTAVKNADGTDIAMPDPHLITEFEKIVELRNALQPESTFMVKCSPVASMVKKDIASFIGIVISGGAGLAMMVPGL